MRGDGLKVIKSRTMSTKFLQLFSLFSFTVDSQCFIAQDFFSISQIERGKRGTKHQFKADLAENQARESRESIEGKHRENLFIHFKEFTQYTRGNRKQATDIISALSTVVFCIKFTRKSQNMSSK